MKNADMAMYLAKEEGKNNFQFFTSEMKAHSIERLALETNLRRALERDEFSLALSGEGRTSGPARSPASRRCCAGRIRSSARCRRRSSSRSPRRPGSSCRSAGGCSRTACEQNMAWQRQGLPPVRMSVNLSMRQLDRRGPRSRDRGSAARDRACDPDLLELEVTESMIMHNAERAVQVLDGDQEPRRAARDRRLRHRLFVARAPEALPDRHAQGRPLVHPRGAERRRGPRDRRSDHRDGQDA